MSSNSNNSKLVYVLIGLIIVAVFILVLILTTRRVSTSQVTPTPSPSSIPCSIYPPCPAGYEEDPLTGCCSPLVPANIVPAPSPTFEVNVFTVLNPQMVAPAVGFLSSSCSRSSNCIQQYCPPYTSVPSPTTSYSKYFYVNLGQVVSSNGTPIPNVPVNINQSYFPQTINIPVYENEPFFSVQVATITVKIYAPPSQIKTDSNGNILVPFLVDVYVNGYNSFLYHLLTPSQSCFPSQITQKLIQFTVQISGTPISIVQNVNFELNYCGCGCGATLS